MNNDLLLELATEKVKKALQDEIENIVKALLPSAIQAAIKLDPDAYRGETGPRGEQGPRGFAGIDGIGIKNININDEYEMIIEFSNNKSFSLGNIQGPRGPAGERGARGQKGKSGNTIKAFSVNDDNELICILSDDTKIETCIDMQ